MKKYRFALLALLLLSCLALVSCEHGDSADSTETEAVSTEPLQTVELPADGDEIP